LSPRLPSRQSCPKKKARFANRGFSTMIDYDMNKEMLFRVVVSDVGLVRNVVTAYKTSKIAKYWSG